MNSTITCDGRRTQGRLANFKSICPPPLLTRYENVMIKLISVFFFFTTESRCIEFLKIQVPKEADKSLMDMWRKKKWTNK